MKEIVQVTLRFVLSVVIALLSLTTIRDSNVCAQSETSDCDVLCRKPEQEKHYVKIDANTGKILGGSTQFKNGQQVQVIIAKKNPYKYDYQVELTSVALSTSISTSLLELDKTSEEYLGKVTGFITQDKILTLLKPATAEDSALFIALDRNLLAMSEKVDNTSNAFKDASEKLTDLLAKIKNPQKKYEEFLLLINQDKVDCVEACTTSNNLISVLSKAPSYNELSEAKMQLESTLSDKANAIEDFDTTFENAEAMPTDSDNVIDSVKEQFKERLDQIKSSLEDNSRLVKDNEKFVTKYEGIRSSYGNLVNRIQNINKQETPFYDVLYPQILDVPTGVHIRIHRRNILKEDAKNEYVATVNLSVGKSLLSFSSGFGISTIDIVEFTRKSSIVDTLGNLGNRFDSELESKFQTMPFVMVNGHILRRPRGRDISLALSLGLPLRESTGITEYLYGFTLGFLDNDMLLFIGAHAGAEQELAGGFELNEVVPSNLPEDIPTRSKGKIGWFFGLSLKLR